MPIIINKKTYYSIQEIGEISGVNMRTLRRWISNGDLDHFLHGYYTNSPQSMTLYRLEPPCPEDKVYEGKRNTYYLPEEGEE